MLVSVIVPARDAAGTLGRTLDALAGQRFDGEFEVIVVDDGSRDGTAALVAAADGPVRLLAQERLGPAAARNRGVAAAGGELLAFCDADVFPEAGWLAAGVEALAEVDLVQGRVLPDPLARLGPFDRTIWVTGAVGLYEAASLFVRRAAFEAVGGFQEWLTPGRGGKALAEDVWFGWRMRRAGYRTSFCPASLAHHAVFERAWVAYVAERARLRFFPAMVARMPELRGAFLHRRLFLNRRTLRFDAALAGAVLTAAWGAPLPLAAAIPYARTVARDASRGGGTPSVKIAAADVAADVVGATALALGTVRWRAPVL